MEKQYISVWDLVADQGPLMTSSTASGYNHQRGVPLEEEEPNNQNEEPSIILGTDEREMEVEETINGNEGEMITTSNQDDMVINDDGNVSSDDDLLTDDEVSCGDELSDQHHIQGPVPLRSILEYVKCSRDIDSISILSHSILKLIHTMESKSIVKISNMVGNIPTTSSRHCVKQKICKRDGQMQTKKTPLHHYQNICLGTLTANNIRFHLVIYSLQQEGMGKTKGYRPMTTNKRLVVVGSLNLARMLQCNRSTRIKKAWTKFCDHDLPSLHEIPIDVEKVREILNLIIERDQQQSQEMRHSQHWVSGGEKFYLKSPATSASEVSTTRDHALDFFWLFEAGLTLISLGILHCAEVWSWCFTPADNNIMKSTGTNTTCSKYSITEGAKNLLKYKMFGLTAAGVKNDFPKHIPFQYCDDHRVACASQQFTNWLCQAGMHNMDNVHACFDSNFDFDEHGVTVTVDDGLNFDTNKKKMMLLPSLNVNINDNEYLCKREDDDSNSGCHDEEDFDNDDNDGHDNGYSDDDDHGNDNDNNTTYSVNDYYDSDYMSDTGDHEDDSEGNNIEDRHPNHQGMDEVSMGGHSTAHGLITARMLAPRTLNKYPILLNPLAASFHTGKIICTLSHDETGISKFEVRGVGDSAVHHGDTVGYQGYTTSVKNTKDASMLKNISRVGFLEKASFGLLHSSLESDAKEFRQLMDTCLKELENLDFSKNALSDALSRSFCFRLECFRCFRSLHQDEDFDAMHNYSYNVLEIPVFLGHKEQILRNYFETLRHAKDTITRVFTLDKGDNPIFYDPRKLSPTAKTGVQFLSEILTFDVGTPSGYSRQGPITTSLIAIDELMTKFGLHYPLSGVPLVSADISFTGLKHGLDPKQWNFIEDLNLHDEIIRIFGSMDLLDTLTASMPQIPALDAKNVDKLRRDLGKRLFRFKTQNKDRDKCSWQLLVSHFILASTGTNIDGNVFGAEEYESFVTLFERNKTHEIGYLVERLAHIFWLCYDWEWRTDLLKDPTFRHLEVSLFGWPNTVGGLSFILNGLAQPKNKDKKVDSIGKVKSIDMNLFFAHHRHSYYVLRKVRRRVIPTA